VLLLNAIDRLELLVLLERFQLDLALVAPEEIIPGSFWGEREAGLIGSKLYARLDTDAGGDDVEESAVCYLQILMADALRNVGTTRMLSDMDEWGYSFRLGSAARWFAEDAEDARAWLVGRGLIHADGRLQYVVRQ
jgi:hypothetical protein